MYGGTKKRDRNKMKRKNKNNKVLTIKLNQALLLIFEYFCEPGGQKSILNWNEINYFTYL